MFDILHLRAYARAKRAYDDADEGTRKRLITDRLVQLVIETEFDLAQREMNGTPVND